MISDELFEKISEKVILLEKYYLGDLAWKKEDALNLLNSLIQDEDEIGISGGDVYEIESDHLYPAYENWSCKLRPGESRKDFYIRSQKESLDYISKYSISHNKNILFSITFSDTVL